VNNSNDSPSSVFLPANSRKFKDFGFMKAYLSFKPDLSEERYSFSSLITIDDAILKPGAKGFGLHSHKNIEVVTFVVALLNKLSSN
jgi:quercetin 2,3-dioxygenase